MVDECTVGAATAWLTVWQHRGELLPQQEPPVITRLVKKIESTGSQSTGQYE